MTVRAPQLFSWILRAKVKSLSIKCVYVFVCLCVCGGGARPGCKEKGESDRDSGKGEKRQEHPKSTQQMGWMWCYSPVLCRAGKKHIFIYQVKRTRGADVRGCCRE